MIPVSINPLSLKDIALASIFDYENDFRSALSEHTGCEHVILTDSGTSALYLLFKAYGVGKNDVVGLPAYVCEKVVRFVLDYGCRLRFFDVDESYGVSPEKMDRVDFLVAIHMFGNPCRIDELKDFAKVVIEDSAQCIGAKYKGNKVGSLGDSAILSFGKGKPLTAMGGGAIVTNDRNLARRLERFGCRRKTKLIESLLYWVLTKRRVYGMLKGRIDRIRVKRREKLKEPVEYDPKGITRFQASLGAMGIRRLKEFNDRRIENYKALRSELKRIRGIGLPKVHKFVEPIFVRLPVYIENDHFRMAILRQLISRGIETTIPYEYAPEFFKLKGEYPTARRLSKGTITLPTHPLLKREDVENMVDVFRRLGV